MRKSLTLALMFVAASAAHAQNPVEPGFFVDTQVLWFDSEIRDEFELAPRFIFGYDDVFGVRVRYWGYDHWASHYANDQSSWVHQRLDFDVIDLEATTHIRWEYTDFQFAGGARIAHIDHTATWQAYPFTQWKKTTMGGITAAGEGRTHLFKTDVCGAAFVYGGRLSMLEAGWDGITLQNERFIVPEVFTGVEVHYGQAFARLTVEMQEWQGRSHNYGFTGCGVNLGYSF